MSLQTKTTAVASAAAAAVTGVLLNEVDQTGKRAFIIHICSPYMLSFTSSLSQLILYQIWCLLYHLENSIPEFHVLREEILLDFQLLTNVKILEVVRFNDWPQNVIQLWSFLWSWIPVTMRIFNSYCVLLWENASIYWS